MVMAGEYFTSETPLKHVILHQSYEMLVAEKQQVNGILPITWGHGQTWVLMLRVFQLVNQIVTGQDIFLER